VGGPILLKVGMLMQNYMSNWK